MDSQLFSGSDPFYKIDPVISKYINDPNIISMLNPEMYFSGINSLTINQEVKSSNSVTSTPISTLTESTSGNINNAFYTDIGCGIIYSYNLSTSVLNKIVSNMPNLNKENIVKSHKSFDDKIRQVLETFSYKTLHDAINLLPVPLNISTGTNVFNNINLAVEEVKNMPTSKLTTLINLLGDTAKTCIIEMIIDDKHFNNYAANDFTPNSLNNNNSEISPTYSLLSTHKFFQLRKSLYNKLSIPSNILSESDDNVKLYVQKILSDLYIKCCCPLIHYDIINGFSVKFNETGDFINLRFCLLAKISYVRNFVIRFTSIFNNANNDESNITNTQNTSLIITRILQLLNDYIQRINNIDLNSNQDQLKNIMKKLHMLSDDVYDKSQKIQTIKSKIDHGQLSLRNITPINNIMSLNYKKAVFKFYGLLIFIVFYVIIIGFLLFMFKTREVYISSIIVIIVILIIKFFDFIIKLLWNNKS